MQQTPNIIDVSYRLTKITQLCWV